MAGAWRVVLLGIDLQAVRYSSDYGVQVVQAAVKEYQQV
jgi:hypothetical protein